MSMKNRILSFFLAVVLLIPPLAVPTSAVAALPGGVAAGASEVFVSSLFADSVRSLCADASAAIGAEATSDFVQKTLNALVSLTGVGNMPYETLAQKCASINEIATNPEKYSAFLYEVAFGVSPDSVSPSPGIPTMVLFNRILSYILAYRADLVGWQIVPHSEYGYIITNSSKDFVLCDSLGQFPYALEVTDLWFTEADALKNTSLHVANHYMLDSLQAQQESLHPDYSIRQVTIRFSDGNRYKVIKRDAPGAVGSFILCDQLGFPYGIPEGNTQMGGDRNYNDDKEDQPETSDDPIVDIDGDLVMQMFPDGSFTWINSVIYDASNKTYNVDASTSYNIENNTYYNYEWHYTYHIDYTSITYIGQTEEYNKYYEYYYDLPDGRSSADLTAEELLALNVAVDVVPYIRSADDTSIRALYHFDGDIRDSSYWNYLGEFQWNKGASITYMDAGVFDGALYLDETDHDFTINLPSNISGNDFTLQFRYYQSYTVTPQGDSYIQIDSWKPIVFTGAQFTSNGGTVFGATSVGNWQEICIQRADGTTTWFINGVPVASGTGQANMAFGNTIQFVFGSIQQTYKYFDEFRFVNKALYDSAGYTPSAVPFDTNLTLVLPDGTTPVADEYWSIQSSKTNLLSAYSLDNWMSFDNSDSKITVIPNTPAYSSSRDRWTGLNVIAWPKWNYNSVINNVSHTDTGTIISAVPFGSLPISTFYDGTRYYPSYGFRSHLGIYINDSLTYYLTPGTYTFSMVAADASIGSVTFTLGNKVGTQTIDFNGYCLGLVHTQGENSSVRVYTLVVQPLEFNTANEFVYLELVQGDSTDLTAEYVSAVAPVSTDFKTPTLAVRTDLDITGYQLGGVRPSLPEKGLVWAMVESGRITSLQIYNGQAWEQVDGRIWTGSRWVPYYAYDLLLLKDLYDIVESDPSLDYIYTEAGFWKWLQSAWGEMMKKLDAILVALGGSTGTSTDESLPGGADNPDTEMDEGWKFIDLLAVLRDGMWSTVKGVVSVGVGGFTGLVDSVSNVGSFFDLYEPTNPDGILGIFVYEGDDLWA